MADEKRLKVKNMGLDAFVASLEALEAHSPAPAIHAQFSVNTSGAEDLDLTNFFHALSKICSEYEVDLTTTMVGKFEASNPDQMRLFPPEEQDDWKLRRVV